MSVLCGVVNGTMGAPDLANAVFGLHWRLALLNSTCFWEWVASESNVADGGSRIGVACEMAHKLGCPLVQVEWPAWPSNFPRALPEDWEKFGKNKTSLSMDRIGLLYWLSMGCGQRPALPYEQRLSLPIAQRSMLA